MSQILLSHTPTYISVVVEVDLINIVVILYKTLQGKKVRSVIKCDFILVTDMKT